MEVEKLKSAYEKFTEKEDIQPGDIVYYKPGFRNKSHLDYGEPAIVVEVNDPPIIDESMKSDGLYFREPLDIVVGLFSSDGYFFTVHCDSRRFTRNKPEE